MQSEGVLVNLFQRLAGLVAKGKWKCPSCSSPEKKPATGGSWENSWSATGGSRESSWTSWSSTTQDGNAFTGNYQKSSSKSWSTAFTAKKSPAKTMREMLVAHGLSSHSPPAQLKKAYRAWLITAHPDKGGDTKFFTDQNEEWMRIMPNDRCTSLLDT